MLRAILLLLLLLPLAGCFETAPLTEAATRVLQPASGPAQVRVLNGAVAVTGPAGYCVDVEATRESDIEAFVLLVRCRNTLRPSPVLSATITGLDTDGNPETFRRLTGFLQSAPGRAQLSRTGDPRDVEVVEATFAEGAIWLLIHDSGNPRAFDETYWRAILPVAGRIVTLSVLAAADHPFERDSGLGILRGFVMRMRAVNAQR
ncbi:MAG: hypothetical protein KDK12_13495 [Rhodobacteraceae bacterium]|nr:hypothetical protein [Paracoccaceae bacterium]